MEERAKILAVNSWHQSTGSMKKSILDALRKQEELTIAASICEIDKIIDLPDDVRDGFENGYRAAAKAIKGHIMNVNTEKE